MDDFDRIVGKKVVAVLINSQKDVVRLDIDGGTSIYLSAVGDCCSTSWFEHLNGVDALAGQTILRVIDREMPETDNRGNESIEFYGWTIETARGRCDVEMRNSSNGYYGGWVEVAEEALDQYGVPRQVDGFFPVQDF